MYWRYFMWNFAGRQNDLQGNGELEHGNWITGIPFIDNLRLGDQSLLPDELKENKGHNVFYCLPLILGLIGLFWQAYRGKRIFINTGALPNYAPIPGLADSTKVINSTEVQPIQHLDTFQLSYRQWLFLFVGNLCLLTVLLSYCYFLS